MNELYLPASLAGVGLLVGLNALLMRDARPRSRPPQCPSVSAEIPGFRTGDSAAAENGAALCQNAVDGATLAFCFSDFTFPKAALVFGEDRDTSDSIKARWAAFRNAAPAE
jgi:hypothetical protein